MSKLPLVTSKQLEKFLLHLGFVIKRQKGSHVFYRHPDGRYTTIAMHGNQIVSRPLIRQILREINISPDDYLDYFKK
jgi:predicted RNA binding protein YcfA (HicA-like mRNA interferase family)